LRLLFCRSKEYQLLKQWLVPRFSMSHSDVKTAMTYQQPELNVVRDAIHSLDTAETVN
jgi:hypothetical protein